MNREPIGLYIFRLAMGFGLFFFMAMLYWSSLLLEENTRSIGNQLSQIKNELNAVKQQISKGTPLSQASPSIVHPPIQATQPPPHADPNFPNLLQPDPFYTATLPNMLGPNFVPWGTFHSDTIGKPDNLHPFNNFAETTAWYGMCSVAVAGTQFGKYESLAPDMGLKFEVRTNPKTNDPEYWIFLRDGVYWHPLDKAWFPSGFQLAPHFFQKHPVTSHDFKFYYDAVMNPSNQAPGALALRNFYEDIKEFEIVDNLTFVVRWKTKEVELDGKKEMRPKYLSKEWTGSLRPLASFVYQYFPDGKKIIENDQDPDTYRKNSVWAQNFAEHWAKNIIPSCGSWLFDGKSDQQINFKRNPDFYDPLAVLVEASETEFKDSPDGIWLNFKSNKTDTYTLMPEKVLEYNQFLKSSVYQEQEKNGSAIKSLQYLQRAYFYIGWNEAGPYFNNKKVRQAMTMAIDRKRIIREYLNGMGEEITGTFFKYSPSYDASIIPLPFDPLQARRLLEQEGWYDSQGTGTIGKQIDGKYVPFRFTLTYFVKNSLGKAICEYIATALKEIGIACSLKGVDMADLSSDLEDKNFDAIFMGWGLGTPPEDPKQVWHSSGAKAKGSSNSIGFSNEEIDKIIDRLAYEYDPKKRVELYHKFDQILYDEQPYTFLYCPKRTLLYREYVQNVFIPSQRQDLIPGANVGEPSSSVFWLKH